VGRSVSRYRQLFPHAALREEKRRALILRLGTARGQLRESKAR